MRETGRQTYFGKDEQEYSLDYLEDDYGDSYVHVGQITRVVESIRNSIADKDEAFDELEAVLYDVEQAYL